MARLFSRNGHRRASHLSLQLSGVASPGLCLFGLALMLISTVAGAQDQSAPQKAPENQGFIAAVSRWFEEQTANVSSTFRDARKKVEDFSSAPPTRPSPRSKARGMLRRSRAHSERPRCQRPEKCLLAPNGAPDCVSAATRFARPRALAPERAST